MIDIKVSVFRRSGRPFFEMQYRDQVTGLKVRRSTGKRIRRDADRVAAKWEAELRESRYVQPGKISWEDFRDRYSAEVLNSLADNTARKAEGVLTSFERQIRPAKLAAVTEEAISVYAASLRDIGRAETTIKGHLAHLMAALHWAVDAGLLAAAPKIKMPKRAKRPHKAMRGRPITTEEFERMLAKVDQVTGPAVADSWKYYLEGLWWSGLRLDESMELHWTDRSQLCVLDLDKREPMLWVPGEIEKGNQDRILPMAPEFAEFLRRSPATARTGYVFDPRPRRIRYGNRLTSHRVGRVTAAIGEAAGVKVGYRTIQDETTGQVKQVPKYASAHDLRRSFGERWSVRVMPAVLQELMRHENIQTTMRYYVGRNAKRTAAILWEVHRKTTMGATLGATAPDSHPETEEAPTQPKATSRLQEVAEEGLEPPTRGL